MMQRIVLLLALTKSEIARTTSTTVLESPVRSVVSALMASTRTAAPATPVSMAKIARTTSTTTLMTTTTAYQTRAITMVFAPTARIRTRANVALTGKGPIATLPERQQLLELQLLQLQLQLLRRKQRSQKPLRQTSLDRATGSETDLNALA